MLMKQNVSNDVSKDSLISKLAHTCQIQFHNFDIILHRHHRVLGRVQEFLIIVVILVTRALDRPKALGNSMQENMRRRVLIAKNRLLEPYGACSLLVLA